MNPQHEEDIIKIVRQTLSEQNFQGRFVFDPIRIIPELDFYDDEILNVIIVVDSDIENPWMGAGIYAETDRAHRRLSASRRNEPLPNPVLHRQVGMAGIQAENESCHPITLYWRPKTWWKAPTPTTRTTAIFDAP